jgi:transcriptional regulator with XRE-family HTH domain
MAVNQPTGTVDSFGMRLGLALKALNVSRVQLAALVGVDKSLVSRWLSSQVTPTAHNLTRISEALAKAKPGFNAYQWERPLAEFEGFVGLEPAAASTRMPPPAREGIALRSLVSSAREVALAGEIYAGLYVLFRQRLMNSGVLNVEVMRIYLRDGGLFWENCDGGNTVRGTALLIRNKLHLIGEGDTGRDGITLHVLNGTGDRHAMVMDGLLLSVGGDRFFTPSGTKVVLLRLAHAIPDDAADHARYLATAARLVAINASGDGNRLLPDAFACAVDNRHGFARQEAPDWLLRVPSEVSLSRSDFEAGNYDFPSPALCDLLLGGEHDG